jgi:hypothetical protein
MSLSVDTFISKIKNNGARSTLFEAEMSGFKGTQSKTGDVKTPHPLFTFMCKGITIPSSTIGAVTVNYLGRPIKYPGNRTFEDLSTTVINDEGHAIRNNILSWMEKLQGHSDINRDSTFATKSNYVSDMTLRTMTKLGNPDQKYEFKNCFPTGLDEIALAWETNDTIMEFTVTWSYDWWEHATAFTA